METHWGAFSEKASSGRKNQEGSGILAPWSISCYHCLGACTCPHSTQLLLHDLHFLHYPGSWLHGSLSPKWKLRLRDAEQSTQMLWLKAETGLKTLCSSMDHTRGRLLLGAQSGDAVMSPGRQGGQSYLLHLDGVSAWAPRPEMTRLFQKPEEWRRQLRPACG